MDRVYADIRRRKDPDEAAFELARRQYGVLGGAQLNQLGFTADMTYRRVATGRLERILPNVFRVAGAPRSFRQRAMAVYLWAGQAAAISHETAAVLLGFPDIVCERFVVSTTKRRKAPRRDIVVRTVCDLPDADCGFAGPIRVTTPSRTLFDLASVVDEETVEDSLDFALRHRMTSLHRMRWTVERLARRGRNGSKVMGRLLRERTPGYVPTHSKLESKLARVLKNSPLRQPVRQYVVHENGRFVARPDFAYPDLMIAIEAVGFDAHQGRVRQQRDMERRNRLLAMGWIVLEFSWDDVVFRPEQVIATIQRAIEGRSR